MYQQGVHVISCEDLRWTRRDIKSVSLLGNVLSKQQAVEAGAKEAWLVTNGVVNEGSHSNSFIVTPEGVIVTQPKGHHILPGITRDVVLDLAHSHGFKVQERPFTLEEAYQAAEAFLTSSSANILPVVRIDDRLIGDGVPGAMTKRLVAAFNAHIFKHTGKQVAA